MEVTTETLERCEVLLTITVEAKQAEKTLLKAAREISKRYKIPGFRPGKAPLNVIIRNLGPKIVEETVIDMEGDKILEQALATANVTPFAKIDLENVTLQPLSLTVRVPTKPEVLLGDYRNLSVEVKPIEPVTEKDVDRIMEHIRDRHAHWVPVERAAEYGDMVSMILTRKKGDTVLSENESLDYQLVSPTADNTADKIDIEFEDDEADDDESDNGAVSDEPAEFVSQIVGLSEGDEKTFTITYPQNYTDTSYAGEDITISVSVESVKEKEVDPLDDMFAQAIGSCETMAEWREKIHKEIRSKRQQERDNEIAEAYLTQVIETAERIDWPMMFEEQILNERLEELTKNLRSTNLTPEAFYKMSNITAEGWREATRIQVNGQLKRGLALSKLAELENIRISNTELSNQAKLVAESMGYGEQMQKQIMETPELYENISNDLLTAKVMERLVKIAKGEAPEPSPTQTTNSDSETPVSSEAAPDQVAVLEEK